MPRDQKKALDPLELAGVRGGSEPTGMGAGESSNSLNHHPVSSAPSAVLQ